MQVKFTVWMIVSLYAKQSLFASNNYRTVWVDVSMFMIYTVPNLCPGHCYRQRQIYPNHVVQCSILVKVEPTYRIGKASQVLAILLPVQSCFVYRCYMYTHQATNLFYGMGGGGGLKESYFNKKNSSLLLIPKG